MAQRDFDEWDIHLALDGELAEEDRAAFDTWLSARPDMRILHARFASDRTLLRSMLSEIVAEPVPDRLTARLGDRMRASGTMFDSSWRVAAAAALLLALGGGAGYLAALQPPAVEKAPAALQVIGQAVAAHRVYAAEKLHVVEVGADEKDHLVGWLSNRVGIRLEAPNLTSEGFELIGGRLLPSAVGAAAQLMYQNERGERISFYIAGGLDGTGTGFRLYEQGGGRAAYWEEDGYAYAVAGALPEDRLLRLANLAYHQFLQR